MKPYPLLVAALSVMALAACSPQTKQDATAAADHAGDAAVSAGTDAAANAQVAADKNASAAALAHRKADAASDAAAKQH